MTAPAVVTSGGDAKVISSTNVVHQLFGSSVPIIAEDFQPANGIKQPRGYKQIEECAISRCMEARKKYPNAWVRIAIESGHVKKETGGYVIVNAICIDDGKTFHITHAATFPIPNEWGIALDNGAELRPFLESIDMKTERKEGIVGHLSKGTLSRTGLYENALRLAFAPLVHPDLYKLG